MRGYGYERGEEGTRWNHGKKGIEKEVWQRKNWSCGKEWKNCGEVGESKGEWDTKGYKGRGVGKVWVGKSLVSEEKNERGSKEGKEGKML